MSAGSCGRASRVARPFGFSVSSLGAWLSPVERCVRVAEVPGSNPGAPIPDSRECREVGHRQREKRSDRACAPSRAPTGGTALPTGRHSRELSRALRRYSRWRRSLTGKAPHSKCGGLTTLGGSSPPASVPKRRRPGDTRPRVKPSPDSDPWSAAPGPNRGVRLPGGPGSDKGDREPGLHGPAGTAPTRPQSRSPSPRHSRVSRTASRDISTRVGGQLAAVAAAAVSPPRQVRRRVSWTADRISSGLPVDPRPAPRSASSFARGSSCRSSRPHRPRSPPAGTFPPPSPRGRSGRPGNG